MPTNKQPAGEHVGNNAAAAAGAGEHVAENAGDNQQVAGDNQQAAGANQQVAGANQQAAGANQQVAGAGEDVDEFDASLDRAAKNRGYNTQKTSWPDRPYRQVKQSFRSSPKGFRSAVEFVV
ncbi:hypothetical protein DAPPUDRAFT_252468 [Daphnia pulex]|uniref:Uncharacterized protein n=1 Tax=Daphnia pulex TaxID=6669 RepID=E9H2R9_DAPPU|nr:hypothetical protein DAPPUDRAFT_252468 [Daphnia pulex]|eukprot:EFX73832.1 hypothetical protein DAPPUDRAFT_252468 [Daphnia pulex]